MSGFRQHVKGEGQTAPETDTHKGGKGGGGGGKTSPKRMQWLGLESQEGHLLFLGLSKDPGPGTLAWV